MYPFARSVADGRVVVDYQYGGRRVRFQTQRQLLRTVRRGPIWTWQGGTPSRAISRKLSLEMSPVRIMAGIVCRSRLCRPSMTLSPLSERSFQHPRACGHRQDWLSARRGSVSTSVPPHATAPMSTSTGTMQRPMAEGRKIVICVGQGAGRVNASLFAVANRCGYPAKGVAGRG
jgi:hypothetical protein